ncbi:hypothetical protein PROFUN_04070 [Planoprotostelium fungivorum]|uniref:TRAF-type domain-containing protein n=1 Tax=Planoprotostelium fungivorum TaxID=1890364 RepID=A0A2P6NJH9_9EUKA|nr:hypothetical protein PROFUN_04070 [Planoprotostelium fungivorum]
MKCVKRCCCWRGKIRVFGHLHEGQGTSLNTRSRRQGHKTPTKHPERAGSKLKRTKKKSSKKNGNNNVEVEGDDMVVNLSQQEWNQILQASMASVNTEKELSVLLDGSKESQVLLRNTAFNSFALAVEEDVVSDPDVPREGPSEKQIQNRIKEIRDREHNQIQFANMQKIMQGLCGNQTEGGEEITENAQEGEDVEGSDGKEEKEAERGLPVNFVKIVASGGHTNSANARRKQTKFTLQAIGHGHKTRSTNTPIEPSPLTWCVLNVFSPSRNRSSAPLVEALYLFDWLLIFDPKFLSNQLDDLKVKCVQCYTTMRRAAIEEHLQNCLLDCPYGCSAKVALKDNVEHEKICSALEIPYTLQIECDGKDALCLWKGQRGDKDLHVKSCHFMAVRETILPVLKAKELECEKWNKQLEEWKSKKPILQKKCTRYFCWVLASAAGCMCELFKTIHQRIIGEAVQMEVALENTARILTMTTLVYGELMEVGASQQNKWSQRFHSVSSMYMRSFHHLQRSASNCEATEDLSAGRYNC